MATPVLKSQGAGGQVSKRRQAEAEGIQPFDHLRNWDGWERKRAQEVEKVIDVSENEQLLLTFTQDSKFHTQPELEDLSFQAQICIDPELRAPAEIRTKLFLLTGEKEWSLSSSESSSQKNKQANKQLCILLLFTSKYLLFFFLPFVHT